MIIIYICAGIAGMLLFGTLYYRRKWRKCEKTLTEQTQNMLDARRKINSLYGEILRYAAHCELGVLSLKYSDEALDGVGFVTVHGGCPPDGKRPFVVKDFKYDPNDPDDHEFAIREARELIEIINNF